MVRVRSGKTNVGCLFSALIVSATVYFAVNVGTVALDYYKFTDRMKQEVRFASSRSDAVIKRRLAAYADSAGLPEAAGNVHVKRGNKLIAIWAEYYHVVELPGIVKEVRLNPQVSGPF